MNKVQLVGRLTKDIEIRQTQNQTIYCYLTIAVDRKFKDANGVRQTDFINCVAWKQTASFIQQYFRKGQRIGICGTIQTRTVENNGTKTYITEVLVEEAEFVESKTAAPTPAPAPSTPAPLPPMPIAPKDNVTIEDMAEHMDLPFEL